MSKSYDEFREAMKDQGLRDELEAFIQEQKPENPEAKVLAIVKFAASRGFSVTTEDLSLERVKNRELSESDLENVTGSGMCWSDHDCFALQSLDDCSSVFY